MKIDFRSVWKTIVYPPTWLKILTFTVTLISAVGSISFLFVDYEGTALSIVVYTLFGIAGTSLTYSVYLLVKIIPNVKRGILKQMERYDFTYLLLRNFGFRTVIFTIGSFAMSVVFSAFNAYMGIAYRSVWYGALATYYIALTLLRGGVLLYHKKKIGNKYALQNDEYTKAKVYRNSGIVTLMLNMALSSATAQMIFSDAHFTYMDWTIFAYARKIFKD